MSGSTRQQNLIVAALPDEERFRIARRMEPVELPVGTELMRGGTTDGAHYFPTSGLASIVALMSSGAAVECGALGAEGWVGTELFAGIVPAGAAAFQQISGSALRMSVDAFVASRRESQAFDAAVIRFKGVMLSLSVQTAACNRLHEALARCARWLLFTHDRVGRSELAITNEYLSQMLGASRSAVSATLGALEGRELLNRSRGYVVVRDAEGLRRVACECHDVLSDVYGRYLRALQAGR